MGGEGEGVKKDKLFDKHKHGSVCVRVCVLRHV